MDRIKNIINGSTKKDKYKIRDRFRHLFQFVWFLITNSYFEGFKTGKIYGGNLKKICVPGMNCYSCPGAKGSCPIGSLQAVIGNSKYKISYYIVGILFFIGALVGRFVCGWLCPFGLIQDLLHKIPFFKKVETFKFDKHLRKLKYIILLVFVIILPLFLVDILGQGSPYFCKLICPIGMLEGGLPLVLLNKSMRSAIGFLYYWKGIILIVTLLLSIIIYRPFCKYICPLGAIYSIFNPISIFRYRLDKDKCINCGKCKKVCQMNIDPVENCNHLECIRCGRCKNACPVDAISYGVQIIMQFIFELIFISIPSIISSLFLGNVLLKVIVDGFIDSENSMISGGSLINNSSFMLSITTLGQSYFILISIIVLSVVFASSLILIKKPKEILSKIS